MGLQDKRVIQYTDPIFAHFVCECFTASIFFIIV